MNIPCTVRFNNEWTSEIEARIIAIVNRIPTGNYDGVNSFNPIPTEKNLIVEYTVDALVILDTFSKGRIYQIPMHLVKVDYDYINKLEKEAVSGI